MLKTYLYIPEQLEKRINHAAKINKLSKAATIRNVLQEGLDAFEMKQSSGVEVLFKIAGLAKEYNLKGPRDASVNHDYYLWGLPKKNPKLKP